MKRIIGLLALLLLLCPQIYGKTWYIRSPHNPSGNYSGVWVGADSRDHATDLVGIIADGDWVIFSTGVHDSAQFVPARGGAYSQQTVYACSTWLVDGSDAGRNNTFVRGSSPASVTWTQVGSTPIWTTTFNSPETGVGAREYIALFRDNIQCWPRMGVNAVIVQGDTSQTGCDEDNEYAYNTTTNVISLRTSTNPNSSSYRFAWRPIMKLIYEDQSNVLIFGLTLEETSIKMLAIGEWDTEPPKPGLIEVRNCNLRKGTTVEASNNGALIYSGRGGGPTVLNQWTQFITVTQCSLSQVKTVNDGLHGGAGIEFYFTRDCTIDSNVFGPGLTEGVALKMGCYTDGGVKALNWDIRHNRFLGCWLDALWIGNKVGNLNFFGNVITGSAQGIDLHTSDPCGFDPTQGNLLVQNNTFFNCDQMIQLSEGNAIGGNKIKYNIFADWLPAIYVNPPLAVGFRHKGGEQGAETPSTESYWRTGGVVGVDSNLYYYTGSGGSFVGSFSANSGYSPVGDATWAQWSAVFDLRSINGTNPNFTDAVNGNFARPTANPATEMGTAGITYGGKTWKLFGAWQPGLAITDTCTQITGKTTLATPNTCYCIVDSLLYTFSQRDTLINTNGMDNIRIYGYHAGGGRGIIGFSALSSGNLSWPTDSSKAAVVLFMNNSDNVTVKNLAIVPRAIADSVRQIIGMNALTVRGLLVENCSTRTAGFSSRAFQSWTTGGGSSMNLDLYNSFFGTDSKGYNRRDQLYGATIAIEGGLKTDPLYQYLVKIHQCRVQTIHTGIGLTGATQYPLFYLDTNTVSVDARNDLYTTYGDGGINNSAGDPFGISCDGVTSGSRMLGNTVTSMAATYYGGDGLLLQHVNATAANPFDVAYNRFYLQHGPHPQTDEGRQAAVGTYIRNYSASLFVSNLHYHHNLGYIVVDTDAATTNRGRLAEGVRMGFDKGSGGNIIENNHFSIVAADSVTRTTINTLETAGLAFIQADSLYAGKDSTGRNTIARNNYWRVPKNPFWFGDTRVSDKDLAMGSNNCHIEGDTANTIYDGDSTFARFHQSGTYWDHHAGNSISNVTLQGYANAADVIMGETSIADSSTVAYPSEDRHKQGKQLSYLRSLTVNLKDATGSNANGGTIWAINAYGHRVNLPNTNVFGNSSDTLRFRFFGYDALPGDGFAVQDSNGYNNFIFWGKLGNDSISASAAINWTSSQTINLQLTGAPPDSIAYVVNGDTVYANLTYDRQWIDFFRDKMGYKVKVITDDAAAAITNVDAYHGYFLSATISGANLTNLRTTTKGVIICDQGLYGYFLVANGQTPVTLLTSSWTLNRLDATHAITNRMFDKINFNYSDNVGSYGYTGLPGGAKVLFSPSNKKWDGIWGDAIDTAFCYAIETGDALTTGVATGRRVVALSHYAAMTQVTDGGWCHPFELMGNIASWAFGDEQNVYAARYNCYSNDISTSPGPEVEQEWDEFGPLTTTGREVYTGARFGFDSGYLGLGFLNFRYWDWKVAPGFVPDSLIWTYKINYRGFNTDSPPALPSDTITLATIVSATRLTFDTTTLNHFSMYDLHFAGDGKGILVRSGIGADTTQKGDTITIAGGSRNGTNDTLYYTRCGTPISGVTACSGFFNGTTGSQVRLIMADPYGGFDFWVKIYKILPQIVWNTPKASASQGGNPEGSSTRTWANRNFIKSGNTDSVRWSAPNLVAGVDYAAAALDSFQLNKNSFKPDGTSEIRIKILGNVFTDPEYNGFVWKTFDLTGLGGTDSSDIEIIPPSIVTVNGLIIQKFEMYLSPQSQPQAVNKKRKLILE